MDAKQGINSLAGISEDKTNISLLLSNFDSTDVEYDIVIENMPFDSTYTVTYYIIDNQNHLQIVDQYNENTSVLQLKNVLFSSSVQFIRITNSSTIPDEGPLPLDIPWFLQIPLFDPLAKILGFFIMILFFG